MRVHYYDDCGGLVADDDEFASEPEDVTCPECKDLGA